MYKWKPKKTDVDKWLIDIANFKNDIEQIERYLNLLIHVNKKGNSIYFKHNNLNYRISTHDKINKGPYLSSDKDLFKEPNQINIITNSRKNIIKHLKRILGVKDE